MAFPKIRWPSGGANNLVFTWQPLRWTPVNREGIRHDTIASAGDEQSVHERTEELNVLEMAFVGKTELEANWKPFVEEALKGTAFDYFPDSALGTFTIYILTDTAWEPEWMYNNETEAVYRFTLRMRKKLP